MAQDSKPKRITMREIARQAGVSQPAVSAVLTNKSKTIKVSEETRQRVLSIIRKTGYTPNAAARALSTRRTGHLGFLLSDEIADGFANVYYANCMTGIERGCQQRGFALNVNLYNLSNVDSFVFPLGVREQRVDGLILAPQYVEAAVLNKFLDFGVPFVCIGDDHEIPKSVARVVDNSIDYAMLAVRHAAEIGHTRIGYHFATHRRSMENASETVARASEDASTQHCEIQILHTPGFTDDYRAGKPLVESWLAAPEHRRPTVIIGNYQTILAALKEFRRQGVRCPQDVSIISGFDAPSCELADPGITAVRQDMEGVGALAARLLIDHLEGRTPLRPEIHRNEYAGVLIRRDSCAPPPH